MENISKNKVLRKILAVTFGTLMAFGCILVFISAYSGLYSKGVKYVWNKYLDKKVYTDAEEAYRGYCIDYLWSTQNGEKFFSHYYDELYDKKNTNFRFTCISDDEITLGGYGDTDEKKQYVATYYFTSPFEDEDVVDSVYYFKDMDDIEASETIENAKNRNEDVVIKKDSESGYYEVDIIRSQIMNTEIEMQVYVPLNLTAVDEYAFVYRSICLIYSLRNIIISFTLIFGIIALYNVIRLMQSSGLNNETGTVEEKTFDKISFDLFAIISVGLMTGCIIFALWMIEEIQSFFIQNNAGYLYSVSYGIGLFVSVIIFEILFLYFLLGVSVRIKSRRLLNNTLFCKFGLLLCKNVQICVKAWQNIKAYVRVAVYAFTLDALIIAGVIFVRVFYCTYDTALVVIMSIIWILFTLLILFEICLIYNIYILETAINKIADGQLDYKLGEKMLLKPFAHSVNAVNHISDGLNEALKKQIQSEHFKTELITNVSHDIKTPLTSIMNYVGLLQQANVSGEEAKDYLEVLERQSGKLKKLIEDMIEASKASTGNLIINLAPIDAGMMVEQAVAEYSDRFLEKGLTVKYDMRSEYSYVLADGKYLWRAFDNLLVNIYKYTLENTRVYIDVEDYDDENCSITFKNISKYEIQLTPDELTERFVRGDKSRNTEGSGLGLSIARGIIESMNGKMYIDIDGDLYKVVVILSKALATQLTEE